MTLQERIELMGRLGDYISENTEEWNLVKQKAYRANQWFIPDFIDRSAANIASNYLQTEQLAEWASAYGIPAINPYAKKVGVVMAGNIPLVGFHDMLCVFISGHDQLIKTSSKDDLLIRHLVGKLYDFDAAVKNYINFADQLNDCEVYIATGGNNTGRYFEYYFGRYPNIIRKNKTTVALLDGTETVDEIAKLADDIQLYFGLGCRNVTKLYVPPQYNFEPLLAALERYDYFMEYHKYRHNYDYQLALLMMGNRMYMTNGSIVLSENQSLFSAVSHLHFEYYSAADDVEKSLHSNPDLQCIVGRKYVPFGQAQQPGLTDYADGIDTLRFLADLR